MHELSVTESILNIALKHAEQAEAKRVTDLHLVIGRLSSLIDDSIQFYWDMISENTICQGATLHFERVPAKMVCMDCGKEYTLDGDLTPCPACHGNHVRVLSGDQFWLDSLEIEK